MKNNTPKFHRKISLYITVLFLFICCIVIVSGFKKSIKIYYEESIDSYNDSRWESLYAEFKSAYFLGQTNLLEASNHIQEGIEDLDTEILRESLSNDLYYSKFDQLLRKNLQVNIFTRNTQMDQNRNNIIVLCNGNVIANYSHTDKYGLPYKEGQKINDNNIQSIIETNFYNVELSLHALDQINEQSEDLIVWQARENPNPNAKKYLTFNVNTLREIYEAEGINGFSSYDVLIPVYITEYGNIFGDHDVNSNIGKDNKIILIQKLNLTDYFTKYIVNRDLISDEKINALIKAYLNVEIMTHLFEIILYLCIGSYVAFIVFSFNRMIEEILLLEDVTDITE